MGLIAAVVDQGGGASMGPMVAPECPKGAPVDRRGSSVELMEPGRNSTGPPVDPMGAAMDPLGATVDRWGASVDPSGAPGIPKGPPVDHLGAPVEPTEPQGDSMGPAVDSMVAPGCGAGQTRAGPHPAGARAAWGPIFAKKRSFR